MERKREVRERGSHLTLGLVWNHWLLPADDRHIFICREQGAMERKREVRERGSHLTLGLVWNHWLLPADNGHIFICRETGSNGEKERGEGEGQPPYPGAGLESLASSSGQQALSQAHWVAQGEQISSISSLAPSPPLERPLHYLWGAWPPPFPLEGNSFSPSPGPGTLREGERGRERG